MWSSACAPLSPPPTTPPPPPAAPIAAAAIAARCPLSTTAAAAGAEGVVLDPKADQGWAQKARYVMMEVCERGAGLGGWVGGGMELAGNAWGSKHPSKHISKHILQSPPTPPPSPPPLRSAGARRVCAALRAQGTLAALHMLCQPIHTPPACPPPHPWPRTLTDCESAGAASAAAAEHHAAHRPRLLQHRPRRLCLRRARHTH